MQNQRLMFNVLKILKHRIDGAHSPQAKSSLIFAYNLIVYALKNDTAKINEIMKNEGLNDG